ncbi:MAG: 23S rRNA (pseudouridine(1915)-N(3))-methyltransferase RlmH [Thiohalocapsa sp.]|nr:23S rRNA (pseudouridine(1915)-N(3))-methyltransferase RlmH [Thiohalocapsa sp.]
MRIRLLSVGRRMPRWVEDGVGEYARRMPPECALEIVEIEPAQRAKAAGGAAGEAAQAERYRREEGERLLKALPSGDLAVALDVGGKAWSTEQLAGELTRWLGGGRDVALLVGGPDGLSPACLERAERRWSLSPLTFPHPLVRVILAEQLYRAWSITRGHPYHRGGRL